MVDPEKKNSRGPRLVGEFIRKKREALGLSQRSLGQKFTPVVTTQFISNIERGVTPLPPNHIATIALALKISESELLEVLEQEYILKLSGRVSAEDQQSELSACKQRTVIHQILSAYQTADATKRDEFLKAASRILSIAGLSETRELRPETRKE